MRQILNLKEIKLKEDPIRGFMIYPAPPSVLNFRILTALNNKKQKITVFYNKLTEQLRTKNFI